ncbi:myosin class II heavy chain [Ostreococcus tauri]|uniref:Myosin class II heavy chain n=1 Tax=Ostreococcus tauri TaxID=70448 RepID=A0A1Y5I7R2_OSTTA|nr:myosin class II heavy chain [Ostreococcus tauri]
MGRKRATAGTRGDAPMKPSTVAATSTTEAVTETTIARDDEDASRTRGVTTTSEARVERAASTGNNPEEEALERQALHAELIAREQVSKAFAKVRELEERCADAEAFANDAECRSRALERELERLRAETEEAKEGQRAASVRASVLEARVALSGETGETTLSGPNAEALSEMLAAANAKLKIETEANEKARSEIERLKPLAMATEEMKTRLERAVAEANASERVRGDFDANERKLRETLTRLNNELNQTREKVRALEFANEDAVRTSTLLQQQAVEAGERIAKNLRLRLDEALDEVSELRRREAVHAAEVHGAAEAVRRAAKFEEENKRVKHQLADVEMTLADSEAAVRALQFQLDMGGDSSNRDDARELRETRLRNELDEARAHAAKSSADVARLNDIAATLRQDCTTARETIKRLGEENAELLNRVDAAEKQIEINSLLGGTSVKDEDLDKLQTTASKVDLIVAENRRLETERDAAVTARHTAEDTAREAKSTLAREREDFEAWKRKARNLIDSKDRELDFARKMSGKPPSAAPTVVLPKPPLCSSKRTQEEEVSYIRTVVMAFLFSEDWDVQQSLLPTLVSLCGGSAEDLVRVKEIRSQFEPTFVHSTEVAINKSLEQSANAIASTFGLGRFFS